MISFKQSLKKVILSILQPKHIPVYKLIDKLKHIMQQLYSGDTQQINALETMTEYILYDKNGR